MVIGEEKCLFIIIIINFLFFLMEVILRYGMCFMVLMILIECDVKLLMLILVLIIKLLIILVYILNVIIGVVGINLLL